MTIGEVSRLTGVTIRTLQHYDRIGLLPPARVTDAGYRIYDQVAPMALDYERRLLAGFSDAERATLAELLERLDEASRP